MYFNIKCIGKLPGQTDEFERYLVFKTGEFERPKLDCSLSIAFFHIHDANRQANLKFKKQVCFDFL